MKTPRQEAAGAKNAGGKNTKREGRGRTPTRAELTEVPANLVAALSDGMVVPFVGAGISIPPPSSIPSAQDLADELVGRGYGNVGDDLEAVSEAIYADGGWQLFARILPAEEWRSRQPNECHIVLAELAAEGLIREILTTNWDTMLEEALNACSVPFTPIARPADLATWDGISTRVVKLHGSIDRPETIRARKSEVDSDTWLDAWADAHLSVALRSKSFVFAGYSGASRATTKSIEMVSTEGARVESDWMVGRSPFETAVTRKRAKELLDALGRESEHYVNMDAIAFFHQLRARIQPQLHRRAAESALQVVRTLLGATRVAEADVAQHIEPIATAWAALPHQERQSLLHRFMPSAAGRSYIPIIGYGQLIGRLWAWLAFALAADAISMNESRTAAVAADGSGNSVELVPVLCGPVERRDVAMLGVLGGMVGAPEAPNTSYVGVVVGGMGPLTDLGSPFNVARGESTGSVAREPQVDVTWVLADKLFDLAERDIDRTELLAAIKRMFAAGTPEQVPA